MLLLWEKLVRVKLSIIPNHILTGHSGQESHSFTWPKVKDAKAMSKSEHISKLNAKMIHFERVMCNAHCTDSHHGTDCERVHISFKYVFKCEFVYFGYFVCVFAIFGLCTQCRWFGIAAKPGQPSKYDTEIYIMEFHVTEYKLRLIIWLQLMHISALLLRAWMNEWIFVCLFVCLCMWLWSSEFISFCGKHEVLYRCMWLPDQQFFYTFVLHSSNLADSFRSDLIHLWFT